MKRSNNVATDVIAFVPRYGHRQYCGLVAAPIMASTAVWLAVVKGHESPELYFVAAFFALCAVVIPFKAVRRIRFGTRIIVDRYLFPPREFEYADVVDIGVMSIKTKSGTVSLYQMKNVDELHTIFDEAMRRGSLSEGQIVGTLAAREVLSWAAASYALVPSVVVAVLMNWVFPIRLRIDGRLLFLLYWLPTYCLAYLIARRYVGRESA